MNKEELNLAMANCFEEIRAEAARAFNAAYDGELGIDAFIDRMNRIKQMCDFRKDRITVMYVGN